MMQLCYFYTIFVVVDFHKFHNHGIAHVLIILRCRLGQLPLCCFYNVTDTLPLFYVNVLEQQQIKAIAHMMLFEEMCLIMFKFDHLLLEGLIWIHYLLRLIIKCFVKRRK